MQSAPEPCTHEICSRSSTCFSFSYGPGAYLTSRLWLVLNLKSRPKSQENFLPNIFVKSRKQQFCIYAHVWIFLAHQESHIYPLCSLTNTHITMFNKFMDMVPKLSSLTICLNLFCVFDRANLKGCAYICIDQIKPWNYLTI